MKILFVVEHFYPYTGGAEELFLGLAQDLVAIGHEVNVITTLHEYTLPKTENINGISIHRIKCSNRYFFTLFSLPLVIKLARKSDLIHTTTYNAAIPSWIASKITGKKVIITFHEVWGKLWLSLPFTNKIILHSYYRFEKLILKLPFDNYIAVSKYTGSALRKSGIPDDKISFIYNGIDYNKFSGYHHVAPENFTFCFFGRLGLSKGIDLLLEATLIFITKHPEAKLKLIIPTYPQKLFKKVMGKVDALNMRSMIILMHDLDKDTLLKEVSTSGCVIIPSISEGFCYTAVEAVAMKVPVISSGKGALPEVVGGQHIQLPELTVEEIVNALERAKENRWNFSDPPKFTKSECFKKYLELYQETAAKN